jgi:hypothetical protein
MPSVRLIRRDAVPKCGSYEIRFPDGRPSRFIYRDDIPARRLRSDLVDSAVAERVAKIFARAEQDMLNQKKPPTEAALRDASMKWPHASEVKKLRRPDSKAEIFILKRDDGLYEYKGYAEFDEDGIVYWGPAEQSGLLASAEEAESNAIDEVPWLRRLARNSD